MTIQEVIKKRQDLCDTIYKAFTELHEMESTLQDFDVPYDADFGANVLLVMCNHRHTFGEQLVTDHSKCLKVIGFVGDGHTSANMLGQAINQNSDLKELVTNSMISAVIQRAEGI
jgi:hypothetical protein